MKFSRALALLLSVSACALAQTVTLMPTPKFQAFDANGYPLAGGLVYTCVAGSSCPGTPLASYSDASGTVANTNPVVLDGGGFANIWLAASAYKIVIQTAAGVTVSTTDNVVAQSPRTLGSVLGVSGSLLYCTNPASPDESCINNAFTLGGAQSVTVPTGIAINSTVNVPAGGALVLMPGTYTLGNLGKIVMGAGSALTCPGGPYATILSVPATYAVTDQVITLNGTIAANQVINGCGISFYMPPAATTRVAMIHYAAYAIGGPTPAGIHLSNLNIFGAWNGFNFATGANNGHIVIDNIQISSFNTAVNFDYLVDTVVLHNFKWWPFGLSAGQLPAFFDPSNFGISSGRIDDLKISDSTFDGGQAMSFFQSAYGVTGATLNNVTFDSNAGITMSAGQITMNGGYFSVGGAGIRAFVQTGGIFLSSNVQWGIVTASLNGQILISGNSQFFAASSYFNTGINDVDMFNITGDGAYVSVTGCQFLRAPNLVYVNPTVFKSGNSRLILSNNVLTDKGTGLGYWVTMTADSQSIIANNQLLGWSMALPGSFTNLAYHDNPSMGGSSTGAQSNAAQQITCSAGQSIYAINTAGLPLCR